MSLLQGTGLSLTPSKTFLALFIPLLLVIPGVVGLQISLWTTRRTDTFSQLEKLVLSALISLTSLFILYVGWSVILWDLIGYEYISDFSLFQVVCGYVLHFATAGLVGLLAGSFTYNYYLGNTPGRMYDSWEYLFEQRHEEDDVKIRTVSGLWLKGHVNQVEDDGTIRDLLLDNVEVLVPPEKSVSEEKGAELSSIRPDHEETEKPEINEEDSIDELDSKIDAEFEDDYNLGDSTSTEQLQFLHLEGSEIEAIGQEGDITEGFDEELDGKDRLQRRTGSIASVFGYSSIENWLGTQFNRANSGSGRFLTSLFLMLGLWTMLVYPAPIGEFVGIPPTFLISFITITILTIGSTELLRYDLAFSKPTVVKLLQILSIGALLTISSGAIVYYFAQYSTHLLIGSVIAGSIASIPISLVITRVRHRYTETVSLTVTAVMIACIGLVVPTISGYYLPRAYGQTLIALGVGAGVVLFIERIRIGQAELFQDWPRVLADILAIGVAVSGAVLTIRAISGLLEIAPSSLWGTIFMIIIVAICILLAVGYGKQNTEAQSSHK